MAERTPKALASYDAVATTPRPPTPPMMTGLPRSEGLSRCSTAAKKASRSMCSTDASVLMDREPTAIGPVIAHRRSPRSGSPQVLRVVLREVANQIGRAACRERVGQYE